MMIKNSRRTFLKGLALAVVALSFNVVLDFQNSQTLCTSYLIKDNFCKGTATFKADKVLVVDNDISEIYAELKITFENKAIVASQSSETTFFVLRQWCLAMDCALHIETNKTRRIRG